MIRFFDLIDRYKFGLLAALIVYIGLFVYFTMGTYHHYEHYEPFTDGSYIDLNQEYVEVKPENLEIPADFKMGDVKNMAKDANDTRQKSMENYSSFKPSKDVEQSVYDLERQMYEASGGSATREEIQRQMEAKQREIDARNASKENNSSTGTAENAYQGLTMVEWSLSGRKPYQNNEWYVRNPGYTGYGNGTVLVDIVVNQNGNVISAKYNPAGSSGANQRMIEQAEKYALMSRFNYSGSASSGQKGTITYRFVSK